MREIQLTLYSAVFYLLLRREQTQMVKTLVQTTIIMILI